LLREKNLITDVRYNASHARKIRAQQQTMLPEDIKLSQSAFETNFESIRTQLENLNKERQIQVLDLLNDYYRYQKLKDSEHSANQLNNKERKVLLARSKIQQASFSPRIPPPSTHPDLGHRTSTLALGATRNMGNKGISLLWRPAYHDLLDPSIGFSSNSSLNFMNVDINYNIDKQKLILDEVRFLEIFSVEPRDEFFKDISWHLSTGWKKQPEPGANNLSYFEGGAGHAYSLGKKENFVFYGLVEGYLGHSWELKNNIRIAPKLRLGFISEPFQGWRLHAYATSLKELIGNKSRVDSFVIQQSLAISRNLSMRISTQRNAKDGLQWHEFGAALHYYF
ncbi:MAG: hypothetical protein OEX19_16370, partial [Gammaproteobacteria bacterium]|nr:hypothetical protein [Gammaproteobacteria bacterium]